MKRFIALVLSLVMALSLCAPAWATEGEAEVDPYNITSTLKGLPTATALPLATKTVTATTSFPNGTDAKEYNLNVGFQFLPNEETASPLYQYWHADYVVSVDKEVPGGSMALAGYYRAFCDEWNNKNWVLLSSEDPVPADFEIRLVQMLGNGGVSVNYEEICNFGNDGTGFLCGAIDLTGENEGTTLTVELRLYKTTYDSESKTGNKNEETGDYAVIGTYTHTFGGVAEVAEVEYQTLQEAVDAVADGGIITIKASGLSAVVKTVKSFTLEYASNETAPTITAADGYKVFENENTCTVKKLHNVTFDNNGGEGKLTIDPMVESEFTLPENPFTAPAGKQFKGWATTKDATEVLGATYKVNADVTFYAIWEDKIVEVPVVGEDTNKTEPEVKVEVVVVGTTAVIKDADVSMDKVVDDAEKAVTIDFSEVTGTTEDEESGVVSAPIETVKIPAAVVEAFAGVVASKENTVESAEIVLSKDTSIAFDADALDKMKKTSGDVTISLKPATEEDIVSDAMEEVIGDRPVFDVNVTDKNGNNVFEKDTSATNGTIILSAPYELGENESAWGIVVYYVDEAGNKTSCNTIYDSANKRVTWETNHMSVYMIGYETPSYGGGYYVPSTSTTPNETVQSAPTFDAGIGLYVGMSVLAAAGSAVVIGKKKD